MVEEKRLGVECDTHSVIKKLFKSMTKDMIAPIRCIQESLPFIKPLIGYSAKSGENS